MSKQTIEMMLLFFTSMVLAFVFERKVDFPIDSMESIVCRIVLLYLAWKMFIPDLAGMVVRD